MNREIKRIFEKSTRYKYPNETSFVSLRDFDLDNFAVEIVNSLCDSLSGIDDNTRQKFIDKLNLKKR